MRLAHAARLLADARALAALLPLARAAGFDAPSLPLPRDARRTLGILDTPIARARLVPGVGPLRALLAEVPADTQLRDAASRLATRLAARAPRERWLLMLVRADGSSAAIAAWTAAPDHVPRLLALAYDPRAVRDSDAETLCALVAHAPAAGASGGDALLAHQRWLDVLGRERLGARFYHALADTVGALAASAVPTVPDATARSELALLYATRCLFLAFLEAKGWLDGDRAFLAHRCDEALTGGGDVHRRLLRPLFFGTLNTPRRDRAPAARAFGRVPFLNGGLFAPTALERRWRALHFDDASVARLVHDLLGRHRFTAREDSASWSEAAVDPEMLGRAFESLMHARDRRSTGAFYTPQPLVEQVTAAALRATLLRGESPFPITVVDDALAGRPIQDHALAGRLHARASALRLLDPACGSGAFLVHALERLAALLAACGDVRPVAVLRRATLTRSIFGVDRNPTAVWLCELRLWLSVVIEADDDDPSAIPPLPNLDHHVRVGDALAPPAGLASASVALGWGGAPWGPALASADGHYPQAVGLAALRARYARMSGPRKRAAARRLDAAERERALATLDRAASSLRYARADALDAVRARDLFGERRATTARDRERLDTLRAAVRSTDSARRALAGGGALPFGFGWHFADAAAAGGFDTIVGNPPWIRPHALPAGERVALRASYVCAREAAWRAGAALANAGPGFGSQVDLAAPFVERSLALLRPHGALALLVPAKLWRSLAGGGLRALLAREARVHAIEDWSDAPAVFDAVTYPSLLVAARRAPDEATHAPASPASVHVRVHRRAGIADARLAPYALSLDADPASPWLLLPADVRAALERLRAAGIPLAASGLTRPTLGVKCGCNEAFLVRRVAAAPLHESLAAVRGRDDAALVEAACLRPVLRGEDLARDARGMVATSADDAPWILWTHDATGAPLAELPPRVARWLAPWRARLAARTDARGAGAWWTLFRTAAADVRRARVAWADLARTPAPRLLPAGDPHVPLNSCYVAAFDDERDARAFACLLAAPPLIAWLGALAEPARGGFRRHLAWTVALLPVPRAWNLVRDRLADAFETSPTARTAAVCSAYGIPAHALAPLLAWDAGLVRVAAPVDHEASARAVREERARCAPAPLTVPLAPTRWRGSPGRGLPERRGGAPPR